MRQSKEFQLKKKAIRKRWRKLCKMSPQKLRETSNRYFKFSDSNVSLGVIREMIMEAEFGLDYWNFIDY
jgi:hypothetical protein